MLRPYLLCNENLPGAVISGLEEKFILVPLPQNGALPLPVSRHPDMLVFAAGGTLVTDGEYYEKNRALLDSLGADILVSCESVGNEYPRDVLFNAFAAGDTLFANLNYVSERVKGLFQKQVNVRQGYAACSTCRVDDGHFITSDTGIAAAAERAGISVLPICEGNIGIDGYSHGFIGGASFSYGENVYFFGSTKFHPDHRKIKDFIESAGKSCVFLSDSPLFDYGGAVILKNGNEK